MDVLEEVEILIVGSGPIGAVFARTLVSAGRSVVMIDIGNQETRKVGDHKKNSVAVQKNISLFTNPAQICCLQNGQNPNQQAFDNLPAAAASRIVGGMGSHWTCCTPRQLVGVERSDLFNPEEWEELYIRAEKMFWTNSTSFDKSIRQQLVKHVLQDAYQAKGRKILSMPLACNRSATNKEYVEWACPASILGDLAEPNNTNKNFSIRPNTQCVKLILDDVTGKVELALVKDLMEDKEYFIKAKKFVICAGAVLTPGILSNSYGLAETLPALVSSRAVDLKYARWVWTILHVLTFANDRAVT
ncbi:putative pyranose 2-oxidase [Rosellinia necatrix]|uniref:Putative pyranose 2-oxidase n=1 Tax=Rosellinia necatrix TaxID=77044 RepID=A0A1S8A5W8_ROSNE|nr:putative pyranose 2-oxidase [Rosellinia necatrix]